MAVIFPMVPRPSLVPPCRGARSPLGGGAWTWSCGADGGVRVWPGLTTPMDKNKKLNEQRCLRFMVMVSSMKLNIIIKDASPGAKVARQPRGREERTLSQP